MPSPHYAHGRSPSRFITLDEDQLYRQHFATGEAARPVSVEQGVLDSVAILEFVSMLEKKLGRLLIGEFVFENFVTPSAVVNMLTRKLQPVKRARGA